MRTTICLALSVALSSCCTLMNPGPHPVTFASEPAGATVYLDGASVGTTPALVFLPPRSQPYRVRYELDGFEPLDKVLEPGTNWYLIPSVIMLPLAFVDAANDRIYQFREPPAVQLRPATD